ncbi:MAG: electron transfer flavoprotein subunit alpha/FixB family protein [Thaumarchaeota archaeon]|nr:electron transfer flavoprotein subunit alpha/FixB family protein [Nitrososphaerota archaeon]
MMAQAPAASKIDDWKGIFVYAETKGGKPRDASLELLAAAYRLKELLQEDITAVMLGSDVSEFGKILTAYGAEKVIVAEHDLLGHYTSDAYTKVLAKIVLDYKPSVVLFPATPNCRDLASKMAARLKTGLAADCTDLKVNESKQLIQIRPDFGGKDLSEILTKTRPQMVTVRPGAFKKLEPRSSKTKVQKVKVELKPDDIRTKILNVEKARVEGSDDLVKSPIVASAGMGFGSRENMQIFEEFVKTIGASSGASRPVVERGWLARDRQVGQSGKTVSPKLYFAIGISGSVQHRVGMENSEFIVAINNDPNAPIFKFCNFGIVGDLFKVLPLITEEVKRIKGNSATARV